MPTIRIHEATNWSMGSYLLYNSPWGAGSLSQNIDYTNTTTFDSDSMTSGIVMDWRWPEIAAPSGVYNFNAISFGNYFNTVPETKIASTQINKIASLSETFDLSLGGETANYDVLTNMFLTTKAGDNSTNIYEVSIFLHTPQYTVDYVNWSKPVGTYTGSGHTWKVAIGEGGTAEPSLLFMPTDTRDVLSGTIDLKGMLDYLVKQGVITGNEYFNGLGMGAEAHQGAGSLTINTFSVAYNAATATAHDLLSDTAGADRTPYDNAGWKSGRDPSANFDNELYLARNPDVKASGMDPLAHYLAYGQAEGRHAYAAIGKAADLAVHPGFDAEYYLLSNADVAKAALAGGGDTFDFAYQHFETYGWHEGRNPNAVFDTKGYLAAYADVAAASIDPLAHYETFGWKEGRDPSAGFDGRAYEDANADVKAAGIEPMLHYLQFGALEGRSAYTDGHFN